VHLTTTQVSLIAAGIALASPVITYWASARLDRDRWQRERRAEAYIDALATLGQIAAAAAKGREAPMLPTQQWRLFHARMEAFASAACLRLRSRFVTAAEGYRKAFAAVNGSHEAARQEAEQELIAHREDLVAAYEALERQIRKELNRGDRSR
jgi:hypothetical protein